MSHESLEHAEITEKVIGGAYEVYNEIGFGFLESIYQKSLAITLMERGLQVELEAAINVHFRGQEVGHFFADLLVENKVIVELKSVRQLASKHEVQLVNYLAATNITTGLLINFGPQGVEVKPKSKTCQILALNPVHPVNPVK